MHALGHSYELLAPAGNWECAHAAIANGADAIYFGLDRFNARLRADNFKVEDLPRLMNFLHGRGARGFVTMNTLVFTDEMQSALDYAAELNAAGVDGVIVQDVGFANLLSEWKKEDPAFNIEIHASTQMTLSSPEGLSFISRFVDLQRAVLARELDIDQIEACAKEGGLPLEVFVHGALCVAYSGQCLTSESLGQRSANRGECAQACRLPYQLIKDGRQVSMGERRYLLSPKDLCSIDLIGKLVSLGVRSYKIEGRLKSPEYVAAVTRAYRKAIDAAIANEPLAQHVDENDRYAMQMVFSRGFSTGWLNGTNHPELTQGKHGKKRGSYLGTVRNVGQGWVDIAIASDIPVAPGDGFVFDAGEDRNEEQGGRIWKAERNRLYFHGKGGRIDWNRVAPGQKVWKTDDPALNGELRKTWKSESFDDSLPVSLEAKGRLGGPLILSCPAFGVSVESESRFEEAINRPVTPEILEAQLGKLGGTGFRLASCRIDVGEHLSMPLSAINAARRMLVEALNHVPVPSVARRILAPLNAGEDSARVSAAPLLKVLCRNMNQIAPVVEAGAKSIYLDFEDLRHYRDGVEHVRELAPDAEVFLATPRIHKPSETGYFQLMERCQPNGVLIRNWGAMEYFRESSLRKIGDFSLNVANPYTAAILMKEGSLEKVTVSYDLNVRQVCDLLRGAPAEWFELVIHQHMPMFHMEHCVFCSFLSSGRNYKDCGRPCEQHRVEIRDRVGQLHPLLADAGCRNTVFNGKAQTAAEYQAMFRKLGVSSFRIELLNQYPRLAGQIVSNYIELLKGSINAEMLIGRLGAFSQLGVTTLAEG